MCSVINLEDYRSNVNQEFTSSDKLEHEITEITRSIIITEVINNMTGNVLTESLTTIVERGFTVKEYSTLYTVLKF